MPTAGTPQASASAMHSPKPSAEVVAKTSAAL